MMRVCVCVCVCVYVCVYVCARARVIIFSSLFLFSMYSSFVL